MSEFEFSDDQYVILLKYFKGDVIYLDKSILKDLKKKKFNDEDIKEVDRGILKTFSTILTLKEKKPDKYAKKKWVYPDWSEEEKESKLKEAFPEDYPSETEEPVEEQYEKSEEQAKEEEEKLIEIIIDLFVKGDGILRKEEYDLNRRDYETKWDTTLFNSLRISKGTSCWLRKEQTDYGDIIQDPGKKPKSLKLTEKRQLK